MVRVRCRGYTVQINTYLCDFGILHFETIEFLDVKTALIQKQSFQNVNY